ncbi:MAG: pyruvate kinase [Candidatus Symbiobacter sp.]|nr:pyruvate kinase [Candidatus Symbiobacter sp.]
MSHRRNAKIVATLGPASSDHATISRLHQAGVDVFRLNFSHGEHLWHKERNEIIRQIEKESGQAIGILADLQGPKLRLATFEGKQAELKNGAKFRIELDTKPGDASRVGVPHPEIFAALVDGTDILIDDGKLRLRVERHGEDFAECEVIAGGMISDRKGLNLPGVTLPLSALSAKDRRDLDFALEELEVDFIALSFVQRPEDVSEAREIIQGRAAIISKIEKPAALICLEEIINLSDGVMVARGDLGVELPPEKVPAAQKRIVTLCRNFGRPVIVATQMLESMKEAPTPTRAEVSDVATAVYDGADAVMLSAESASGKFPFESVSIMSRIISEVESDPLQREIMMANGVTLEATSADAITSAACEVAETMKVKAIVTYTTTGSTTLRASRERPVAPILGLSSKLQTTRRLSLAWGVHPAFTHDATGFSDMVNHAAEIALREKLAVVGDSLVVTAGYPFGKPGHTNTLRVVTILPNGKAE